ncbi:MAG: hypothetical protein U1G05_05870 [Kiritimatiellia bacterium]
MTLTATDVCGNSQSCQVNVAVTCGTPSVQLTKTVYPGHDGGAFCPGGGFLAATNGAPVTYCFEIRNTGALNLVNLVLTDPALGIAPVAAGNLGVGQSVMLHLDAVLAASLTNVAQVAGTSATGLPVIDTDEAEVVKMRPALQLTQTGRLTGKTRPVQEARPCTRSTASM